MNPSSTFALTLLLALAAVTAFAQPSRLPPVESPVVHADRTVTFRFRAPAAQKIELSSQFLKANQPMQKDEAGTFNGFLTEKKIKHVELITDGGHTWMNARHYLAETLQRFFRK